MTLLNNKNGFSLVELMVAMVISLMLTLGLFTMFRMSSTNVTTTSQFNELHENGRVALTLLEQDLRMTNYFWLAVDNVSLGQMIQLNVVNDCIGAGANNASFPTDWENFRTIWGYQTGGAVSISCLQAGAVDPGTDVLQVKRLSFPQAPLALNNRNRYFAGFDADGRTVNFFRGGTNNAPNTARNFRYLHRVYYIKTDDGIPNLKRRHLAGANTLARPGNMNARGGTNQQLVQGIENMRFLYGIDIQGSSDTDDYVSAADVPDDVWDRQPKPNAENLPFGEQRQRITAVKIFLLVRSIEPDNQYIDNVEYTLGDRTLGPFNDNFRRKVVSTTVVINNG